jgi:hypothetical protein
MRFLRSASTLVLLSLFVFVCVASAQDLDNVSIGGKITDSNGAPIVGATVTATETQTGAERNVTTNDEGKFLLVNLKPGNYKVKAIASGFGILEKPELTTISGQAIQIDFQLSPAGVQASATVTSDPDDLPVVDTTRTVVGGTITQREIEELPNVSRSPLDLVLTLGGTSEEQLSVRGLAEDRGQTSSSPPLEQGNFSLSGGVAYSNNLTIDGLDNNDDRSSRERFQPSLESIAEVQVITNQFSAEYGRASGGRINLRTRAGGNHIRGRLFGFFRDESMNANSWYNNSRSFKRLPLSDYNPGVTFSGPVILPFYSGRNRTFFSAAYEYDNVRDTTFIDTFVPVGSNPNFELPAGNAPCPVASCTDALSASTTPIAPYVKTLSTPNVNHILTARVDHRFSSKNDITLGYQFGRKKNRRTTFASTTRLDDALQIRNSNTDALNVTYNRVFGPKTVNQTRGQYSIFKPSYITDNPLDPVVIISYRNPLTSSNQTLTAGNSTIGITGDATAFPQNRRETRYQLQDSLTNVIGDHVLKFGFDVQKVNSEALGLGDATGTWRFANVADYVANRPSSFVQNFGTQSDVNNTYWSLFGNDEMKLATNLTLSYGLRYERETAVDDTNNFGPRLGIAWDPFKKGAGVIRFGAGIFYNRALLRTIGDFIQNSGGNLVQFDSNTIGTSSTDSRQTAIESAIAARFPSGFSSPEEIRSLIANVCPTVVSPPAPCTNSLGFIGNVTSTGNPLRSVEPGLKIPESYQFNIGFEREVWRGWVFEANYTWNKTVHLWRDYNSNVPVLPAGYADWTAWLLAHTFTLTNQNGTTARTYSFVLGSTADTTSGVTGNCSFTANSSCIVNLNTTSTSTATPAAASTGTNGNAMGAAIGIARAAIAQFRPNQSLGETSVIASIGNAFYQGLILEMRSRRRGLGLGFASSFRFNYTLSKTMDDGLNNTSNAEINGDFSREWARSLQDRHHRIAFSGIFDTPYWLGRIRFSPLFRYGSSAPFNLGNGGSDRNLDDNSTDRPNFSGNPSDIIWREPGSPVPTTLIAQFTLPPIGSRSGNLPRNAGKGPSFYTFDLNVTREWKFSEHTRFRPVIEFNNILNAAVFSYGSAFIDFSNLTQTGNATARQNFLVPTRTYSQRQIRVGMRLDF